MRMEEFLVQQTSSASIFLHGVGGWGSHHPALITTTVVVCVRLHSHSAQAITYEAKRKHEKETLPRNYYEMIPSNTMKTRKKKN